LPGIGEKTAEAILQMREKNGKFRKLEELKKVKGIGEKKFEKIKKYIFI
jgi:competence protein ComEA